MVEIKINSEIIKLDSFLKWSGATTLGSEAKFFIQNGEVKVNGEIEKRRGRKLKIDDLIEFNNETYKILYKF
ncbi:MAG: S4 domain-containing protein YaaA [Clostridium botulinum]|nr:S4 domain-containing protein YaaA [Clostridium botulinum]